MSIQYPTAYDIDYPTESIDIYAHSDTSAYRQAYIEFLQFVDKAHEADTTIDPYYYEMHLVGPDAKPVYCGVGQPWKLGIQEDCCSDRLKNALKRLEKTHKGVTRGICTSW